LEYGFSVEYPADWDVMEDFGGTVVLFAGPMVMVLEDQHYSNGNGTRSPVVLGDQYMVNVNIQVTELPEEMTLEDLVKASQLQDKRNTPNYNKVEEYNTTIAEQSANVQTITGTTKLNGDDILLKDAIAIFVTGKVAYMITYDVTEEFHDEYVDSFELVIKSFKFEPLFGKPEKKELLVQWDRAQYSGQRYEFARDYSCRRTSALQF
jgi:hypothetical protein